MRKILPTCRKYNSGRRENEHEETIDTEEMTESLSKAEEGATTTLNLKC